MTHWSWRTGAALVAGAYLGLAALILWAPHPAVKAWAVLMIYPAPPYVMEGALMSFGGYIAKDWGHGAEEATPLVAESVKQITHWGAGYCDPDDPPWWC